MNLTSNENSSMVSITKSNALSFNDCVQVLILIIAIQELFVVILHSIISCTFSERNSYLICIKHKKISTWSDQG